MKIHVKPIASDGQTTIGYDDDGLAGQWPGNMTEVCDDRDFSIAREGQIWSDGTEIWDVVAEDGAYSELTWRDGDGDEIGAPR